MCSDGSLLAAWFGGTKEANPDVRIWFSRLENSSWSTPQSIPSPTEIQHWNPVLFASDETTISLFYKIGYPIRDWKTMVIHSQDQGRTWSEPEELIPGDDSGGRGPVKNKPIRLSNGTILAPASTEQGPWRCFVDRFDGITWQKKEFPVSKKTEPINVIQPTLWEYPKGCVHALMRSNKGRIYSSVSCDYGETWEPITPTDLPNNNSGLDCVRTDSGIIVLVCNPIETDWGARSPLTVFTSTDNGLTFKKALDLETEPGEYSYPAITSQNDQLYITYTYNRKKIVFCQLEL